METKQPWRANDYRSRATADERDIMNPDLTQAQRIQRRLTEEYDRVSAERDRLRAENAELREALEILLKGHKDDECAMPADKCIELQHKIARAALAKGEA